MKINDSKKTVQKNLTKSLFDQERSKSQEKIQKKNYNANIIPSSKTTALSSKSFEKKEISLTHEKPTKKNNLFDVEDDSNSLNEANFKNFYDGDNPDSLSIINGLSEFEITKIKEKTNKNTETIKAKLKESERKCEDLEQKNIEYEKINEKVIFFYNVVVK